MTFHVVHVEQSLETLMRMGPTNFLELSLMKSILTLATRVSVPKSYSSQPQLPSAQKYVPWVLSKAFAG